MILNIFTIHDKKAEAYLPPFYLPQTAMAIRTFSDCVNNPEHQFSLHPQDYTLMSIGNFDDQTAIAMTHAPESLGNGLELIRVQESPDQGQLDLVEGRFEKTKTNSGKTNVGDIT